MASVEKSCTDSRFPIPDPAQYCDTLCRETPSHVFLASAIDTIAIMAEPALAEASAVAPATSMHAFILPASSLGSATWKEDAIGCNDVLQSGCDLDSEY
jgi:hypothetical protein